MLQNVGIISSLTMFLTMENMKFRIQFCGKVEFNWEQIEINLFPHQLITRTDFNAKNMIVLRIFRSSQSHSSVKPQNANHFFVCICISFLSRNDSRKNKMNERIDKKRTNIVKWNIFSACFFSAPCQFNWWW